MARPPLPRDPQSVPECLDYLRTLARIARGKATAAASISWARVEMLLDDIRNQQTEDKTTEPAASDAAPQI